VVSKGAPLTTQPTLHRSPRLVLWVVAALTLALAWAPGGLITRAFAATDGGFEIDGNSVVNTAGNADWASVSAAPSRMDNAPSETTVFSASSKEDNAPSTWSASGSPPTKVDVVNAWSYSHNVGSTPYFDFAWTRTGETGTGGFYLELNKTTNTTNGSGISVPNRSVGDARFRIAQTGTDTLALDDVATWNGSDWVSSSFSTGFDYAVNSATINMPGQSNIPANGFVEVSLDLHALLGLNPGCPPDFGAANFRAYTGESVKNLEDYINGFPVSAGSTCSSLKIEKRAAGSNALLGGATFRISPDPTPGSAANHLDVTDNDAHDANAANGVIVIEPAAPGNYTIEEIDAPAGYDLPADPSQDVTAPSGAAAGTVTFHDPISLVTLTVKKVSVANETPLSGGHFSLYRVKEGQENADVLVDSCVTGANGTCSLDVPWGHTYYWVETQAPDGYNLPDTVKGPDLHVTISDIDSGIMTTFADDKSAITTNAHSATSVGGSISDTAALSHVRTHAGGSITFELYGPFPLDYEPTADSCTEGKLLKTLVNDSVDGPGSYSSGTYAPASAGTYLWVASYSGDLDGNTVLDAPVSGTCGDPGETSTVGKAPTSVTTHASDATLLGDPATISDSADLHGVTADATGTLTFALYSAGANCTGDALKTWTVDVVAGTTHYTSGDYTATSAGDYDWLVTYSGDGNNQGSGEACGAQTQASDEVSTVAPAEPFLTTNASPAAVLPTLGLPGGTQPTIQDVATLHGATSDAGGTVSFALFGPSATADCSGTPVFTSDDRPVIGGQAVSEGFAVAGTGHYWWTAHYSGDANNAIADESCGSPNEDTAVTQADLTIAKGADPAPGTLVQPGQQIDYTVTVTNSGDAAASSVVVVDTLPKHVTVVDGSISDGGVLDATAGTITWTLDVDAASATPLTYSVTVDADTPQGAILHNAATMGEQTVTTDHPVAEGSLGLVKSVDKTEADFGDTLTYTFVASALGTLDEHNVIVRDVVPDKTTYLDGSAACEGSPCTTSYDAASQTVSWALGDMTHGTQRVVTFKVTIDTPTAGPNGGIAGETIVNFGDVRSDETPSTLSNKVRTVVTAVLGVKHVRKPPLPFTGAPILPLAGTGLALVAIGVAFVLGGYRRRES